jgi:hypothetical protein
MEIDYPVEISDIDSIIIFNKKYSVVTLKSETIQNVMKLADMVTAVGSAIAEIDT